MSAAPARRGQTYAKDAGRAAGAPDGRRSAALSLKGLTKWFGGLAAVSDVSFDVPAGAIHALIGPNGAGKTTIFNLIAGVYRPNAGQILLDGMPLTGRQPHQVCHAGIARTFQIVRPLHALTLEENVTVGALRWSDDLDEARAYANEVLGLLGLDDKRLARPDSITLPDRKRLEVARALATKPRLLLLDEVMAGLRPTETDQMVETFRAINAETGMTILLTEHVMRAVMALSQRVIVMHHGQLIAEGSPAQVVKNPAVLESYLGESKL